jgi:hypothetical protein
MLWGVVVSRRLPLEDGIGCTRRAFECSHRGIDVRIRENVHEAHRTTAFRALGQREIDVRRIRTLLSSSLRAVTKWRAEMFRRAGTPLCCTAATPRPNRSRPIANQHGDGHVRSTFIRQWRPSTTQVAPPNWPFRGATCFCQPGVATNPCWNPQRPSRPCSIIAQSECFTCASCVSSSLFFSPPVQESFSPSRPIVWLRRTPCPLSGA